MAKYTCPFCDAFAHTSGEIPNPHEHLVWSDAHWSELPVTVSTEDLYAQAIRMFKCVGCDALAVFWGGMQALPRWYSPAV